jgi:hypothetical protein
MENINELAALIVGVFLPLGIAMIQQPKWENQIRAIITLVSCVIAAVITAEVSGELTGKTVTEIGILILVTAGASYKTIWKPIGLAGKIEAMTSPKSNIADVATSTATFPDKLEPK